MSHDAIGAVNAVTSKKTEEIDAASTNIPKKIQPKWNTFGQTNIWDEQKAASAAHIG